jgi:hypothetical protein
MPSGTPALHAQLQAFKDFRVKHPRLEEMDRALTQAIAGHRSYTLLALYGPSGVGKSTVMQRVASRCRAEEPERGVVPVVVVQASPEDIGASARLDYYRQVLAQLRGHVAVEDRVKHLPLFTDPRRKSHDPAEWLDLREAVVYALELLQVKAVFVDEAQHLMSVDTPHRPAAQLDWLKALTNRTNVLHVLVGNFALYDFCHLNGQAARRMRDLHFPRYHFDQQTECEEFVGALRAFLERVPLAVDVPGLLAQWRWFGEWSLGCIGVLFDWILDTVDALIQEGATTFTVEALKRHSLQADQRLRMEMEARTGEHKVARAKAQSEQELQRLLGDPTTSSDGAVAHAGANGDAPETSSSPPPRGTHAHSGPTRAASRDPVGDQVNAVPALKCPFAEVVEIAPQQFLDSGVSRVECPECTASRQLALRQTGLRFPTHDPLKKRAVRTGPRWVKGDTTWEVVGGAPDP